MSSIVTTKNESAMLQSRKNSVVADSSRYERGKQSYRVTLMGAAAVGKTSIVSQFLHGTFPEKYKPTVEGFHQLVVYQDDDESFQLDILDMSGACRNEKLCRIAISMSDAFILVYAVDDWASFTEVRRLRQQVIEEKGDEATPIVIVGNKSDVTVERRVVRKSMAKCTADVDWNNGYVETSAKRNVNIADIFKELMVQAGLKITLSKILVRNGSYKERTCCNIL